MNDLSKKYYSLKVKKSDPFISIIILNWNRKHLLEKTLNSLVNNIPFKHEVIVLDNASTDGASEYIDDWCKKRKKCRAILLKENIGGEAINIALKEVTGDYIFISENDLEYSDDWLINLLSRREYPKSFKTGDEAN
ncbi:glycosyltransferase family 2 protein [Candidatus Dojkabacteria bacterium]|uniref:Glycosyltransferase family 2 protein n=1 Tax=Candidatus Dojkabacteria bacterium TaxID=2099670 RepID=A0A955KXT7_9BACT|nr:glycosyltransferase family 2 protein [Candidatus Dojkabacteria bacterium]